VAFDEELGDRVRDALPDDVMPQVTERKMFGGLAFMLNGNMFVGIVGDELMARLGPERGDAALTQPHVREMDFSGRPMRGMVFIAPEALAGKKLNSWVADAISFAATLPPKEKKPASKSKPRKPTT
jgi:hypothetical protein